MLINLDFYFHQDMNSFSPFFYKNESRYEQLKNRETNVIQIQIKTSNN